MEKLTYSLKQSHIQADRPEKWEENSTISLLFYEGVQFTDRRSKDGEQSTFDDAVIVFEGEVDEAKITSKDESMYEVWSETKKELEEIDCLEELNGTDEMVAVAKLDQYYSRNNIQNDCPACGQPGYKDYCYNCGFPN